MIWQLLVLPPSLCSISAILSRLELTINILYGTVHVGKCIFRPFQCFHYMEPDFLLFIYLFKYRARWRVHGHMCATVGLDWFDRFRLLHAGNSESIDFQ